jgi:DNA-binding GntR family transcriptional regulator
MSRRAAPSASTRNTPRDTETSAQAVARYVRRLVFEGALTAGQRLPQDDIADAVGVSRIPVREAIIALEREGWVHVVPHRGAFINALDDQAVLDRFALYGRFYGFAVTRALQKMTPADLESLRKFADQLAKVSTAATFERANTLYMSTLVRLADSSRLRAVLRSTVQIVPGNFFATVPSSIQIQKEGIAAIQSALQAGDEVAAAGAFAAVERRHAREVIKMMNARRRAHVSSRLAAAGPTA